MTVARGNGWTTSRCYLASPHGFSEAGRHYHREVLVPALARVVEVVDPWTLGAPDEFARARAAGTLGELVREIGRRNAEAIRACDLLVACLDGQELDSGTASEVGFAAALGVRCLGLRTDLRRAGEEGALVNLQVQAFIELTGGRIAGDLDELLGDLTALLSGGRPRT